MRKKQISFDTVLKMGLALPGVEESTTYGAPSLKVGGKMAWRFVSAGAKQPPRRRRSRL